MTAHSTAYDIVRVATGDALRSAGFRYRGSNYYTRDGREVAEIHWERDGQRVSVVVEEIKR